MCCPTSQTSRQEARQRRRWADSGDKLAAIGPIVRLVDRYAISRAGRQIEKLRGMQPSPAFPLLGEKMESSNDIQERGARIVPPSLHFISLTDYGG